MGLTVKEIINIVLQALENQGIILKQEERILIENESTKLIEKLMDSYEKKRLYTRFSVIIPCDIKYSSLRNRTVRKFIKAVNPAVEMSFELCNNTLTLVDSIDIFQGKINTFPTSMIVGKKERPYSYQYEEK